MKDQLTSWYSCVQIVSEQYAKPTLQFRIFIFIYFHLFKQYEVIKNSRWLDSNRECACDHSTNHAKMKKFKFCFLESNLGRRLRVLRRGQDLQRRGRRGRREGAGLE